MSRRVSRSSGETDPVTRSSSATPSAGVAEHAIAHTHASTTRALTPSRVRVVRSRRCHDEAGDVMALRRAALLASLAAAWVAFGADGAAAQSGPPVVVELRIDGVVDPFIADHVEGGMSAAADDGGGAGV